MTHSYVLANTLNDQQSTYAPSLPLSFQRATDVPETVPSPKRAAVDVLPRPPLMERSRFEALTSIRIVHVRDLLYHAEGSEAFPTLLGVLGRVYKAAGLSSVKRED